MMEFIEMGGVFMWPILLCTLLVLLMSGRTAVAHRRGAVHRSDADTVLFWGLAAAVLGVLSTLAGVLQMASAIALAGGVSSALVWSGIRVTLVTSITGIGTLLIALLLWMALRTIAVRTARAG